MTGVGDRGDRTDSYFATCEISRLHDFLNRFPRARARAFLGSKKSNLVSKLPTNSTGSPAHEEIDLGYAYRAMDLGLIVDPEASEANQGRPDGTARPAGEKVSVVGVISL